jgi:Zn-dependent protease with chaperone function
MDFFREQARARERSRWLVFLVCLAVLAITLAIYLAVTLIFGMTGSGAQALSQPGDRPSGFFHGAFWEPSRFFWTFVAVGGVIGLASLYRIREISRMGGALIATELGGRPVSRGTRDARERRFLNVLDEMSIAAGIPAPQAFILERETALNAFAAGMTTHDSVVTVTRGLLDQMKRDQLQGVVGHEISHIVNGDARLNLHIIGVLYGILFLTQGGRVLLRARGKNMGPVIFFGVMLMLIGSIGLFFGKMIQAAVSREREYLADASAVQFTRNPEGLAGALRQLMLSGSQIQHPKADAASHLFFGASHGRFSLSSLFATHPPLEKRIARIDRNFKPGTFPKPPVARSDATSSGAKPPKAELAGVDFLNGIGGTLAPVQLLAAQTLLAALPETLTNAVRQPEDAQAIVYALLLSREAEVQTRQLEHLRETHAPESAEAALKQAQWLFQQGARFRLPLLDLALPALRELSLEDRKHFLASVDVLIRADGRVCVSEFAICRILKSALNTGEKPRAALHQERLQQEINTILAVLAHAGNADREVAAAAFQHGAACAPTDGPWIFPERKTVRLDVMDATLENLAQTAPRFREKLLAACVAVAEHDGKITQAEAELLRALAQSLNCPAPPVVFGDLD